jgi:hypothetical protein
MCMCVFCYILAIGQRRNQEAESWDVVHATGVQIWWTVQRNSSSTKTLARHANGQCHHEERKQMVATKSHLGTRQNGGVGGEKQEGEGKNKSTERESREKTRNAIGGLYRVYSVSDILRGMPIIFRIFRIFPATHPPSSFPPFCSQTHSQPPLDIFACVVHPKPLSLSACRFQLASKLDAG